MTRVALQAAVDAVSATRHTSPLEVIAALKDVNDDDPELARFSRYAARFLTSVAREPTGRLVFPSDQELDYQHGGDVRLTVVTCRGLDLPRSDDPKTWSDAQARAVPLWALTAWKIEREIFAADRNVPKGILQDEGYKQTNNPVGVRFNDQVCHDARKHDLRNLVNVHSVTEALRVIGLTNLVDTWFTGRTTGPDDQRAALEAQKIPVGVGYEAVLGDLDNGEFLTRIDGKTERVQVDLGPRQDLAANQNTTPDPELARLVS